MSSTITALTSGGGLAMAGDTSGQLELKTNNGTTAMTIDTAQNVGIGGTPRDVSGYVSLALNDTTGGLLDFYATGTRVGTVSGNSSNMSLSTITAVPMVFSTNTNEAMRIDASGYVSIGTTSAAGKLTVNQTDAGSRTISASSPASYAATMFRSDSVTAAGTGWYHLYGSSSSSTVNNVFIYGNGNIQNANNSYGAISDIKLKENIVDATPKLDKLLQVKVRNYNLKGEYEQHKQIGVIAQELETVFPSLIEETQDRGENDELLETTTKSVKYSVFVPMLIKALQELNAKVDAQALEIQALKGTA